MGELSFEAGSARLGAELQEFLLVSFGTTNFVYRSCPEEYRQKLFIGIYQEGELFESREQFVPIIPQQVLLGRFYGDMREKMKLPDLFTSGEFDFYFGSAIKEEGLSTIEHLALLIPRTGNAFTQLSRFSFDNLKSPIQESVIQVTNGRIYPIIREQLLLPK